MLRDVHGAPWGARGTQGCPGVPGMLRDVPRGPQLTPRSPQRCLQRILQGLQHYRDLLGSDIFTAHRLPQLETTLDRLLGLVQVRGSGVRVGVGWQPRWGPVPPAAGEADAHQPQPRPPPQPRSPHSRSTAAPPGTPWPPA